MGLSLAYMFVHHMHSWCLQGQKKALDPGTKLQMVMSHHIGAGNCVKGGEFQARTRHLESIFYFWCVPYSFFSIQEKLNTESVIIHLGEDAIKCKV